MENQLVMTLGI